MSNPIESQPLREYPVRHISTAYYADLGLWSVIIMADKVYVRADKTLDGALGKAFQEMVENQ